MKARQVLVTGGAGFIGSHLVESLASHGHQVRILDVLDPQVHGANGSAVKLPAGVEMLRGDILDENTLERALSGVQVVFHQAASVGVGQSMYKPAAYTQVNSLGTAKLMERIATRGSKVEKVVVASSMSLYGEGSYACPACGPGQPAPRHRERMAEGRWEAECPACGEDMAPRPTREDKPVAPTSVYAVTKRCQEETVMVMGRAYGVPSVALRYFNVYGPGQALSNPYTGVAAIFASRILNGAPPLLFEDGGQSRDFIHVSDIVRANLLAMESPRADYEIFNVGTGRRVSLLDLATGLLEKLAPEKHLRPEIVGSFREGDIRHCYADISRIREFLGFVPQVPLEKGYDDLAAWARTQSAEDRTGEAREELLSRGLLR
ncbi:MAG TPA: NAD-dependent epimerase/dehydratase family protein [Candidatus Polarisedimenticolia bacterium]|nr:NAD-dependent epimerase/dehydratase family protein [Candidatus Polarisedimenticolia bacterium]